MLTTNHAQAECLESESERRMKAAVAGIAAACAWHATAVNIPFRKIRTSPARHARAVAAIDADDLFGFQNLNNNVYAAEITVQGVDFTVSLSGMPS